MKRIYLIKPILFSLSMAIAVIVLDGFVIGLPNQNKNIKNPAPMDKNSIERGKTTFFDYCAGCHGMRADGRGPQALNLEPKPQNLRNAQFVKYLTDERIFSSISGGVRGTAMQAFEMMLADNVRWDVINYVRSLTSDDKLNLKNSLLNISISADIKNPVQSNENSLAQGMKDYMNHCASCHGRKADGAGMLAPRLVPAPRNLLAVKSWGEKPFITYLNDSRLFDSIANGVPGTSMAPWGSVLAVNNVWNIVNYLRYEAIKEIKKSEGSGGQAAN